MNPTLLPACVANNSKNPGKCLFAEHVSPFIKTPIFALQARYDTWQIGNELGNKVVAQVRSYGAQLTQIFQKNFLAQKRNGAFLDSCAHHCGGYDSIHLKKINSALAFQQWY